MAEHLPLRQQVSPRRLFTKSTTVRDPGAQYAEFPNERAAKHGQLNAALDLWTWHALYRD
jgi:hypothetical protein